LVPENRKEREHMNVGELLRERDRLLAVLEEAKSAKNKLKQVNIMIAMYGDASNVELVSPNGHTPGGKPLVGDPIHCEVCDAGPFSGKRGADTHMRRMHGTETAENRRAVAANARKARKVTKK
jgi:hypothetical protein